MKLVLGVDFSSKALHCVYGELDAPHPILVRIPVDGAVAEDWIASVADRLGAMLDQLELLGEIEISFMVIERPFYSSNPRTALKLAQVQAAAICTAHTKKWVATEVDPSKIRKEVLGRGTSSYKGQIKEEAIKWVQQKYGKLYDSDESDAFVIWEYACRILKQSS